MNDSRRAQISQITPSKRTISVVYQWFTTFTKSLQWAHSVNIKGLKEF